MIPFTMKILDYKSGSYTVEYIPERPQCKPVKLNVQLDHNALQNKDTVLERLKLSSPQDFWHDQILAYGSENINDVATELINTTHSVDLPVSLRNENRTPVDRFRYHPPVRPLTGPNLDILSTTTSTEAAPRIQDVQGSSTPEQVAGREEQNIIKLKILVQQVIQEMAEGTV